MSNDLIKFLQDTFKYDKGKLRITLKYNRNIYCDTNLAKLVVRDDGICELYHVDGQAALPVAFHKYDLKGFDVFCGDGFAPWELEC